VGQNRKQNTGPRAMYKPFKRIWELEWMILDWGGNGTVIAPDISLVFVHTSAVCYLIWAHVSLFSLLDKSLDYSTVSVNRRVSRT